MIAETTQNRSEFGIAVGAGRGLTPPKDEAIVGDGHIRKSKTLTLFMTVAPDLTFNFDDPDLFLNFGPIWSGCKTLYGVIDVCLDIKTDKACATVKLVGIEIGKACVNWQKSGSKLSATIDLNNPPAVGIWKLSGIIFSITHDSKTNDGFVNMTATLDIFGNYNPLAVRL